MNKLAPLLFVVACQKTDKPAPAASQLPTESAKPPPAMTVEKTAPAADMSSIWSVPIHTLEGQATTLDAFKGKELLVVNVASECGNTPQYEPLEALQKKYEAKGFTVVGFPCNQFGGQEPGTPKEIHDFATGTYGVTFPLMEKIEVNGDKRNPIYAQLTTLTDDHGKTGDIQWNFEKFVVSADRKTVTRFSPKTQPDDPAVVKAIEDGLPKAN
jgi:glutathione peroxidase